MVRFKTRLFTCHMGSHSVACHRAVVRIPPIYPRVTCCVSALVHKCCTMSPKTFIFGVRKVKGHGHETQNNSVSVFRRTAILPVAACVSYAGVSLLQFPTVHAMLVTPGFPCVPSRVRCCRRESLAVRDAQVLHGGLAVGRWTCDLQVAGSIPGRSAFT